MGDSNVRPAWAELGVLNSALELEAMEHDTADDIDNHRVVLDIDSQQYSIVGAEGDGTNVAPSLDRESSNRVGFQIYNLDSIGGWADQSISIRCVENV